jgi:hypothetical protein
MNAGSPPEAASPGLSIEREHEPKGVDEGFGVELERIEQDLMAGCDSNEPGRSAGPIVCHDGRKLAAGPGSGMAEGNVEAVALLVLGYPFEAVHVEILECRLDRRETDSFPVEMVHQPGKGWKAVRVTAGAGVLEEE